MKVRVCAIIILALVLSLPLRTRAAEPAEAFYQSGHWQIFGESAHYLDLGLGLFDAGGNRENHPAGRVELRLGKKLWFVGPAIGFLANSEGGYYGYGGIYSDIAWKKLVFTPFLAAGGYEEGDGKDLGGTFQFRTALGISYQFESLCRMGLQIAHISNADIHDYNPGEEEIYLTFAWPF